MNSKEKFKKKLIEIREKNPDMSFEEWKQILIDALKTVVRESLINNKKLKIQPDKDKTNLIGQQFFLQLNKNENKISK